MFNLLLAIFALVLLAGLALNVVCFFAKLLGEALGLRRKPWRP